MQAAMLAVAARRDIYISPWGEEETHNGSASE
jgi:hypothetical protein